MEVGDHPRAKQSWDNDPVHFLLLGGDDLSGRSPARARAAEKRKENREGVCELFGLLKASSAWKDLKRRRNQTSEEKKNVYATFSTSLKLFSARREVGRSWAFGGSMPLHDPGP